MNEFGIKIPVTGLLADEKANSGMVALVGLRVRDGYYDVPTAPTMSATAGQAISGMRALYLCGATGMKTLNPATLAVTGTVFSGTFGAAHWHLADFGNTLVATVGGVMLYHMPVVQEEEDDPATITGTAPVAFDCCCAHNLTRLIYGKGNIVYWGTLLGDDLYNILLGTERDARVAARGEHGTQALPWSGGMVAIKPMGTSFVVYGTDGISVFRMAGDGRLYSLLDVPGLPAGVGIGSPNAADGDSGRHIFSGTDGKLYALTAEKCEPLGFEWLFNAGSTSRTVVYDQLEQQWWISGDSGGSYILTQWGLAGPVAPTVLSCCAASGRRVGTGAGWADGMSDIILWTGGQSRMEPGQKRLTYFRYRLDADIAHGPVRSAVRYKRGAVGPWLTSTPVQCSRDGAGFVNKTVHDAQAGLFARLPVGSKLWGMELRYQNSDGRSRRGPTGLAENAE